ncbi:MAG: NAD-binding protein [Georgfuchsia sp.]
MTVHFQRSTRRLLVLLGCLPLAIVGLGLLYMFGMEFLEHKPRGLWQSIEWAAETITTNGYGYDSYWQHPLMNLLVIFTELLGMFFVVLFFPIYVLPFMEERFESRLQRHLPPMAGRVLIQGYGPAVDSLVVELGQAGIPLVILEEDDDLARSLRDRGYDVVAGKLEEQADLLSGVAAARALITNADDHTGATFIMIARENGFTGTILALAEDPLHRAPMEKIGASAVFTPSHVLAAALGARASTLINPRHEGLHQLADHVGLAEFRVHASSPLAGKSLRELRLRQQYGVSIVGQWVDGHFNAIDSVLPHIEPGAILVAAGAHDNLRKVESLAAPINRSGPIVIAGHGAVGRKVVQMLQDAGESTVVIDSHAANGVDVVGNVLEQSTLDRARVRDAKAVVMALSNDSAGIFATAVLRDYAPEVPLIARVNRAPNVGRLYEAGADFALSVGQVAGQILAYHLLEESSAVLEQNLKFARMTTGTLVGAHPWRAGTGKKTGGAIIAIERGMNVFTEFDEAFRIVAGDALFICGTAGSLEKYAKSYGASVAENAQPRAT